MKEFRASWLDRKTNTWVRADNIEASSPDEALQKIASKYKSERTKTGLTVDLLGTILDVYITEKL